MTEKDKVEVLGEVPSYEEIVKKETQRIKLMTKLNDVNNENHALRIENDKLKELLKRTRKYLSEQETPHSLIKRIDEVLGEEQ